RAIRYAVSNIKDTCHSQMESCASSRQCGSIFWLDVQRVENLDQMSIQFLLLENATPLFCYQASFCLSFIIKNKQTTNYYCFLSSQEKEAIEAVSVGAILSDYQRVRVENVCLRLGLQPLAYLWRRDQESLLSEMISSDLQAILIKVAAFGLDPEKHLGKSLADMQPYLKQLSHKYGVHICGEGGEYETFTLNCPLFKKKIVMCLDVFWLFAQRRSRDGDSLRRCFCSSWLPALHQNARRGQTQRESNFCSLKLIHIQSQYHKPPSCSRRCSRGYQWISGINGLWNELQNKAWKMKDIVLVHLYVRNMEDFVSLNAVYRKYFNINPPARVCVQAPLPAGQLLQMDCLLHDWTEPLEEGCFRHKEALHVQSLSHWAPANIGPYSQAFKVDELVFCAGQIPLVPCTMSLVKAATSVEAQLSFSHVKKVLEAVIPNLTLAHVVQAHCYITRHRDVATLQWESEIKLAPLLIVVIPALPKDAAVELHVTAVNDDPARRTSRHVATKTACGSIRCHTVLSADGSSASLSLSMVACGGDLGIADVKSITEELGTAFMKATKAMEAELVPQCARVFYKCRLEESLRSILGESSPSVALVPVLDLPDSQILHLSCWLSL
uniref:Diphthine--ammonia ligase n=1 Tax=Poecilia latipinna TaxID=48699 RepID=A0A3B3VZ20_9TELE